MPEGVPSCHRPQQGVELSIGYRGHLQQIYSEISP
jgi:hypothetical protein